MFETINLRCRNKKDNVEILFYIFFFIIVDKKGDVLLMQIYDKLSEL